MTPATSTLKRNTTPQKHAPTELESESVGSKFAHDFMASIVVFLVALPLCMGIAVASNVPIAAGLISGIIGGVIVGYIAGAPLQVSGPAAGLSVLVYKVVEDHEKLGTGYGLIALSFIVLIAGAFQLLAGVFRVGQWFRAVSPAVVQGMLAGIGVLIFASQFHVMVDDTPRSSGVQNILTIPESLWKGLFPVVGTAHQQAAFIGVMTIVILAAWKLIAPKKLQTIPAPLVAVIAAAAVAASMQFSIKFIDPPGNLLNAITPPSMEGWMKLSSAGVTFSSILLSGLAFGIVASAETLLSVNATDRMHRGPRAKYDRELFAQGVGNMLCGAASALPMTGVIVRSAANIESGARTRWSAVMHGVWLLVFVSLLPQALELIPRSCLGAILVYTGYKLVNFRAMKGLLAYGKSELLIYFATLLSIVLIDLLTGVIVGLVLSVGKLVYTFTHLKITMREDPAQNRMYLKLTGAATFLRLPLLASKLEKVPGGCELHVDISQVDYIDHACLDLLMSWQTQHESLGGSLVIDWGELHAKFFDRLQPEVGRERAKEFRVPAAVAGGH